MLDTLTISKELEEVGFTKEQADAIAQIEVEKQENLATKDGIAHLEEMLEGKINTVEQVLGERTNSVGSRVTGLYRFMGIIGATVVGQFVLSLFSSGLRASLHLYGRRGWGRSLGLWHVKCAL